MSSKTSSSLDNFQPGVWYDVNAVERALRNGSTTRAYDWLKDKAFDVIAKSWDPKTDIFDYWRVCGVSPGYCVVDGFGWDTISGRVVAICLPLSPLFIYNNRFCSLYTVAADAE